MINRYPHLLFILAGAAATALGLYVGSSNTEVPKMHTFTDPGTGCHYLVTSTGGITPRLHSDFTQVCEASEDGWPLEQDFYPDETYEMLPEAEAPEPAITKVADLAKHHTNRIRM